MEMKLELVPVPVSDVDRAKAFYLERVGFELLTDTVVNDAMRVVQFNPPGSGCSIVMGTGMPEISDMAPGSQKALHLVVSDIQAARGELIGRGVEVGEVQDLGGALYAYFADPDGNSWLLQQWTNR